MAAKKTRVLIVDDSLFMREFIRGHISGDSGIEVAGTAKDAAEAMERLSELRPDVMTLDVEMPGMSGIELLRRLMPQSPLPVIVVSATPNIVLDAMQAGAVDFVAKPASMGQLEKNAFLNELLIKIKIASIAKVGQHKIVRREEVRPVSGGTAAPGGNSGLIVGIGASTGGTEATAAVLGSLKGFCTGIVVVQHMPPVFTRMYAERLNNTCALEVKEAADGDELFPNRVLIAPGDFQMEVERTAKGYRVRCYKGEKVSGHCPSVDVLFKSLAREAGPNAMGVIMTGMGSDGAQGLLEMRQRGAYTVGQNKETCVVYGMPMVANNIGAVHKEAPLSQIPRLMCKWYEDAAGK